MKSDIHQVPVFERLMAQEWEIVWIASYSGGPKVFELWDGINSRCMYIDFYGNIREAYAGNYWIPSECADRYHEIQEGT